MPERSEGYDSTNVRHIRIAEKQAKAEEDARRVFVSTIMGMGGGRALYIVCSFIAMCLLNRFLLVPTRQRSGAGSWMLDKFCLGTSCSIARIGMWR